MKNPYKDLVIEIQVCYRGYGLKIQTTSQLDELVKLGWRVAHQETISYQPAIAIVTLH